MAGGACMPGTNIDSKEQRKNFKTLMKDKNVRDWMKNPYAKEMGWTDRETFQWLWKKYTRTEFDVATIRLNPKDIEIFSKAIKKEFLPKLGKQAGYFETYFKLPKVLAKGFKGGEDFVTQVGEAVSYNQKLLKDGAKHIKKMTDGMFEMFLDPTHPLNIAAGKTYSKEQYKYFQNLERELLVSKPGSKEQLKALNALKDHLGSGGEGDPVGGQMLRRFNDLLTFKTQPETPAEHKVRQAWDILRMDSMKDLLNGSIAARRTIEGLLESDPTKKTLIKAYETISQQIESLLIQSNIDKSTLSNQYRNENGIITAANPKDFYIYDPKTRTKRPYVLQEKDSDGNPLTAIGVRANGEKSITKYSPDYVIELTDMMSNLVQFAKDRNNPGYKGKQASDIQREIENSLSVEAISNRLKQKGSTDAWVALDPIYYLNKYVHDVASFNMRSRINHSFSSVAAHLVDAVRRNEHGKGKVKIAEHATYLLDMLTEIKDSALMNNGAPTGNLDHAVRIINSFEYISKLGFSFKSGIKNRTQGLLNWVMFGKRGYRITEEFYTTTSRMYEGAEITNSMMYNRQLKRFGMMIGEKAEGASISAATGGSLDVMLIPPGFGVDGQGKLVLEKGNTLKKIAEGMAKGADWSSKYTILGKVGSQQWAENANRLKTFKMQFAHSFTAESNRLEFHRKQLFERNGKEPTVEQLWDYIEKISGNQAFEMVKTLHFDYDNWAKAKVLQRGTGMGAGQVIGQFQHFKFAFFDLQYNILRDMARDVKGFKFTVEDPLAMGNRALNQKGKKMIINPAIQQGMRLMSLYSLMPALVALVSDYDIGGMASAFGYTPFDEDKYLKDGTMSLADRSSPSGLIDNPIIEEAKKLLDYVNNWNHDGDEKAQIKHYSAYYGKNPITGNLGPFVSDLLTIAELTDFMDLTGEEYEEHRNLNYDPDDPQWWYQVARIFNIQGARTAWKTIPAIAKGQSDKAFRIETGMYKPKWITNWRKATVDKGMGLIYGDEESPGIAEGINILPETKVEDPRSKRRRRRRGRDRGRGRRTRDRALLSLANF
tara:strand:- start:2570 stop:5722 length:3153 start_codon:yes stop_codon:yes gene_type:complete